MTKFKALKILKSHQKWRLGSDSEAPTDPKELTEALGIAITSLSNEAYKEVAEDVYNELGLELSPWEELMYKTILDACVRDEYYYSSWIEVIETVSKKSWDEIEKIIKRIIS